MRAVVGISQKIKRAWIDALLDQLTRTTAERDLRAFLDTYLESDLPGKESRAKCAGIVLRIWSGVPPERVPLRERAVAMLPRISGQERLWLHWGMSALAYPFFRDTAEVVGRLLTLQDDFTTAQVQGRMLTTWGDRATSKEATQKLITTLLDWEVLRSTKAQGHFLLARKMAASTPDLQLWLLEALLGASAADEIEAQQLLRLPESFPFTFSLGIADLRKHDGFNIHRQGLDMDMVALRRTKLELIPKSTRIPKKGKPLKPDQPSLFDAQVRQTAKTLGTPQAVLVSAATANGDRDHRGVAIARRGIGEPSKNEMLRDLSVQATGVLDVRGSALSPAGPFDATSNECAALFLDGRYFGCIALAHSALDAIIQRVWRATLKKKPEREKNFVDKVYVLHKISLISDDWKVKLDQVRVNRHHFHDLSPSVETDKRKIEEMARNTLAMLSDLKREFFGFSVRDGMVVPDHPEYWSTK